MLRKLILGMITAMAMTSVAFANGATYQEPHPSHDIYLGVGGSRDFAKFHVQQQQVTTISTNIGTTQFRDWASRSDINGNGWNAELFAGIGWTVKQHFYLGGEVYGMISNADAISRAREFNDAGAMTIEDNKLLELEHSFGVSFIPGYKFTDSTMIYGRVGAVRSKFRIQDTYRVNPATFANPEDVKFFDTHVAINHSQTALQLGIGLSTMLSKQISASIEYDWASYGTIKATAFAEKTSPTSPLEITNQISRSIRVVSPTVNQVKLAVAYHFVSA